MQIVVPPSPRPPPPRCVMHIKSPIWQRDAKLPTGVMCCPADFPRIHAVPANVHQASLAGGRGGAFGGVVGEGTVSVVRERS